MTREDIELITQFVVPWERLSGKTLLIAGAAGFLPFWMVRTVLALNDSGRLAAPCKVVGLVRNSKRARERFAAFAGRADLQLQEQDISRPLSINGGVDFIVHAASQASPRFYGKDPVGTILANTVGTANLLQAAVEKQVESFLYFSSGEVYGRLPANHGAVKETDYGVVDPTVVRSCYAEGKRAGETLCASFASQHRVPAKIVRPWHTYGAGVSLDDGRVFADFVRDIVEGRDIVMHSDGIAARTFCYVADATAAFFLVLLTGEIGVPYNISDARGHIRIGALAQLLVSLFPERGLRVVTAPRPAGSSYIPAPDSIGPPDTSRIQKLGWQARTPLAEGFRRMVQSYLDERHALQTPKASP